MKWTWTINIVTVVCDLNKVGLKALIYCHHGVKWDGTLGSRQSISYLISSNKSHPSNNRLPQITPTPTPLGNFSFFYPIPVIIRLLFQKIRYCMKFLVFFVHYIHTAGVLYFFSPNSCIKITLFYNTTVYKLTQSSFILITQILYKHLLPKI